MWFNRVSQHEHIATQSSVCSVYLIHSVRERVFCLSDGRQLIKINKLSTHSRFCTPLGTQCAPLPSPSRWTRSLASRPPSASDCLALTPHRRCCAPHTLAAFAADRHRNTCELARIRLCTRSAALRPLLLLRLLSSRRDADDCTPRCWRSNQLSRAASVGRPAVGRV